MNESLVRLLKRIPNIKIYGNKKIHVSGISSDSRQIGKNYLFVAIKGLKVDSHKFINYAIGLGASVIVGEQPPSDDILGKVVYIQVKNSRETLGKLWSAWFSYPSRKLRIIGVTGTDGKTTTSNLIWWIFKTAGKKIGLVSTINAKIDDYEIDTGFHVTNPESYDLQNFLQKMVAAGCHYAVLEVTSHGIDQGRVSGIKFDTAVFTNISREHLDYHKNFDQYRRTKTKLFGDVSLGVVNRDDASWRSFKDAAKGALVRTYSLKQDAYCRAKNIYFKDGLVEFNLKLERYRHVIQTHLVGDYNVSNILAAIVVARFYSISWSNIIKAMLTFTQLTGRMEKVAISRGVTIYVDFAHTPNALKNALTQVKTQTEGNLVVVFGSAGERDLEKRITMPKVSINIADISIFTAEDPRNEDVNQILGSMKKSAIENGGIENKNFFVIPDRGEAIFMALNKIAKNGDTVIVCGKGHEKSMAYNGVEYPWSDHQAVKMALEGKIMQIPWKK